jgi:hypothetical protein
VELRDLAGRFAGEPVKAAIARAAKMAGLGYWRAFDIWYGKARRVERYEREQIYKALAEKQRSATRNELHELKLRLARLESDLAIRDAEFYSADIAGLRVAGGVK